MTFPPHPNLSVDPAFLLEQISDACYVLDRRWRFTLVNRKAEVLLGRSRRELLGRDVWECFPFAESLGVKEQFQKAAATGQPVSITQNHRHKDGWYTLRARPTPDGLLVFIASNGQQQLQMSRLTTLHRVHLAAANQHSLTGSVRAILGSAIHGTTSAAYAYMEDTGEIQQAAHPSLATAAASVPGDAIRSLAERATAAGSVQAFDATQLLAADGCFGELIAAGVRGGHAVPFDRNGTRGAVLILAPSFPDDDAESISYLATLTGYIANAVATGRILEQLERSVRDYGALARFGQQIETINDIDRLVTTGLQELLVHLSLHNAALAEVKDGFAVPRWRAGQASPKIEKLLWQPIDLKEGVVADAVRTGKAVLVSDYQSFNQRPAHLDPIGFTSVLALSIDAGSAGDYVFILASRNEQERIDETDVSIATLFAHRLGNAFERVAYLDEVKATREATFRALGLALEYRDYETKGHTDRVVELAMQFGQALSFSEAEVQALQWGAYLHDLGKLSVPDHVLLKPARLTAEEFELIKRHPVTGADMCRDIPFLPQSSRNVVRHHHERWDGAGYPDGLSGNDIPLEARLFSLVDVYDALTSDRPYRDAWSSEQTLAYLQDEAGRRFDPELVDTFVAMMRSPGWGMNSGGPDLAD